MCTQSIGLMRLSLIARCISRHGKEAQDARRLFEPKYTSKLADASDVYDALRGSSMKQLKHLLTCSDAEVRKLHRLHRLADEAAKPRFTVPGDDE